MSSIVYTEDQLKKILIQENIKGTLIYYSLVKKDQKTMSVFSNYRMLIYDSNKKIVYYSNQTKAPFIHAIPQPKNNMSTSIKTSIYSNPPNTPTLEIISVVNNSKNQLENVEWIFTCQTKQLAKQWIQLIQDEKNKKFTEITGNEKGAFIHDTLIHNLGTSMKPKSKLNQSIVKPDNIDQKQEQKKIINEMQEQVNLGNTGKNLYENTDIRVSQTKPIERSKLNQTYNKPKQNVSRIIESNSRINESNSRLNAQNTKPIVNNSKFKNEESFDNSYYDKNDISKSLLNINLNEESRVSKNSFIEKSQIRQDRSQKVNDWNQKFLKYPNQTTILEFQNSALTAFMGVIDKDNKNVKDPKRIYETQGMRITVSNMFSKQASLLKREFRNYHFILESTRNKLIIGVPLATLFQYEGIIGLVKSTFPQSVQQLRFSKQIHQEIKDLERYTRISNNILDKASIYDLTQIYGSNQNKKLIYLDNLIEYLPMHADESFQNTSLRPEFILDNVNQLIPGGDLKSLTKPEQRTLFGICESIQKSSLKELVASLSANETMFLTAVELKELFHSVGINMKYLPKVYTDVTNKQVKKYIHTVMAAKATKDHINEIITSTKKQNLNISSLQVMDQSLRLILEGNNSNSSQIWKDIALKFKKNFGMVLNNSDIISGYYLNSLLSLIKAEYDLTKLNKNKSIFKEVGVIAPGFVIRLLPKIKSYYKFTTQFTEKVKYACKFQKKSQQISNEIVNSLDLTTKNIPIEYMINSNHQSILQYLSYYHCPSALDSNAELKHLNIYEKFNVQTPSSYSLRITSNYLQWCLKKDKIEDFKKNIDETIKIINYWLEEGHLYYCEIFELLSDYYAYNGNNEESINYMKESLSICLRACGSQSKQVGNKYYQLAERQLRAGRKKQSFQNFQKAKINMESNQNKGKKYPQLLMRLASLHLNNGNIEGCIEYSLSSLKNFEEFQKKQNLLGLMSQGYKIKTFEILGRAYEISNKKNQLKQMAILCSKRFMKSNNNAVFEQMVRLCVTAAIFKNSQEKCQQFLYVLQKIKQEGQSSEYSKSIGELRALSQSFNPMQRFIDRFERIERTYGQLTSKKTPSQDTSVFISITKYIIGCVSEDYILGLINQKQYQ